VSRVSKEDAGGLADILFDLEAGAVDSEGEIVGHGGHYAGLSAAWSNFAEQGVLTRP
jgi:hypothetical protein